MNRPDRVAQPLFSRSFGDGPREVLALHCTMAHSGAWRGLSQALPEVTLHAPDMPNHGKSGDWDGTGDFQQRVVDGVAAHLIRPMDVVGHSFGATVALRLALDYPHLVRSVTLIEPVYFAFIRDTHPEALAAQQETAAPFNAAVEAGDFLLAARLFNAGWGDGDADGWDKVPESSRLAMARGVQIVPACAPAIIGDRHRVAAPGAVERAAMPAMLVRGSETSRIIALTNDAIAARLPDARNEVVQGAGHMVPLTHPGEVATMVRRIFAAARP